MNKNKVTRNPGGRYPEEFYTNRYGAELGRFIFNYKKGRKKPHDLPWNKAYQNIKGRCVGNANRNEYYKSLGIKVMVKPSDLKAAFIRDKAYLMEWPSVDRMDPDGHYEPSNIRWIEFAQNSKETGLNNEKRAVQYSELEDAVEKLVVGKYKWRKNLFKNAMNRMIQKFYPEVLPLNEESPLTI